MFCPFCGNQIANEESIFCMNCGKKIHDDTPQPEFEQPDIEPSFVNRPAVEQPMVNQSTAGQPQPQSPQYVQPQAPSIASGNTTIVVKSKRNLIWIPIVAVIVAGAIVATCLFFFKSDEQKIRDRIDTFATACSESDIEGMINCFDSRTRKTYETMMSFTEGLMGGLTGFDLPLGDMVELFGMESGGQFEMKIEVHSVEINGDSAEVEVTMDDGSTTESDVIVMCKEDDDWYLDFSAITGEELSFY